MVCHGRFVNRPYEKSCLFFYRVQITERKGEDKMSKLKNNLLVRLLLGIVLGALLGRLGGVVGYDNPLFTFIVRLTVTFTKLFATFLSFLIPLLIISFVAVGMSDLGSKAGKLFGSTLALAYGSTILGGTLAYLLGSAILPRIIAPINGAEISANEYPVFFTIEVAPVCGVMTALVLAFLLGLGMAYTKSVNLKGAVQDLQNIISKTLTKVIIPVIPFYIAGLFLNISASGELVPTIAMFAKLYVMILLCQWAYILIQFGIASVVTGQNLYPKLKNILPGYFTALGTQSSAATIPVNMQCARNNQVTDDVTSFVIPLCATIHLSGDTICLVLGSMGIMLANGMTPTLTMFLGFILMLGVTMVAAPGVPGGGVMAALGLIESMLGFTDPMQSLIISLHLSQDSFGTACNVTGDHAVAFMVDSLHKK